MWVLFAYSLWQRLMGCWWTVGCKVISKCLDINVLGKIRLFYYMSNNVLQLYFDIFSIIYM